MSLCDRLRLNASWIVGLSLFLVGSVPVFAGSPFRAEWVASSSALPTGSMIPGLSWFHHASTRAEAGPSPRVKYRDRYHTAGYPREGLTELNPGDILKTPPDAWLVFRSGDGAAFGLLPSSEVRWSEFKLGGAELLSGEAWFETSGPVSGGLFLSRHFRILDCEGICRVQVVDSDSSTENVRVRVFAGKIKLQPRSDGEDSGSSVAVSSGEEVRIVFPGASVGVDNQRYFSAMEAEPEFERTAISDEAAQKLERYRAKPTPVASPVPSVGEG